MPEGLQGTLLKELVDLLRIHSRHAQLFQCAAAGIIIAAVNGRGHGDKGAGQRRGQTHSIGQRGKERGAVLGILEDVTVLHG